MSEIQFRGVMFTKLRVVLLGFRDGFAQPSELSSGMTYPDADLSETYDRAVSAGQHLGAFLKKTPCQACEDDYHGRRKEG